MIESYHVSTMNRAYHTHDWAASTSHVAHIQMPIHTYAYE